MCMCATTIASARPDSLCDRRREPPVIAMLPTGRDSAVATDSKIAVCTEVEFKTCIAVAPFMNRVKPNTR